MKTKLLILALAVCMTANARVPEVGTPQRLNVPSGTDTKVAALSPDGEYVLLTDGSNRGLTRFDLATAKSTVLSTAPRAGYNVRIAESSTRPQVRIEDRHMVLTLGDQQIMLVPNGEDKSYIWPSISPDGRHLCYYVCADGCYVCDLNGTNVRRIARDCRAPQWLDNATIIGMNDVDDGEYLVSSELVAYTLQGERQVLTPSNMAALYPRCAGNKIVFSTAEGDVYSMTYTSSDLAVAEHVALPAMGHSAACRPVPARKTTGNLPLSGKRFYLNPGHGSYGPNDRPMATIPYPNLPTTGMPDTCGFYESNTNLWKVLYLGQKLEAAGATVLYSRTQSGPWPYQKVNGDYPAYTTAGYKALPDYEAYNRVLSEICEEVESNNINYFISVHSNAASEGSTTNYPLYIYRGQDSQEQVPNSKAMGQATWKHRYEMMLAGIDPCNQSATFTNLRGDWDFYGSHDVSTRSNGKKYDGYLGVLKHGAAGGLWEGYFHTYQPARHRALNQDYCHMEGLAYYRGILDYYKLPGEEVGYVMGTVKDLHNKMANNLFQYAPKTNDQWVPCNGAIVTLKKGGVEVATYTVDSLYNGIFVFENLTPGTDYTLEASCGGYYDLADEYKAPFEVKANQTTYPMIFLEDTSYTPPTIVYYNYPEPEQPAYLGLRSSFEMTQSYVDNTIDALDGQTIRRVLYRDGKMYILALDATKNPTLIEVDPATKQVLATLPTDFCSVVASDGRKLSDITFTADGYLIGCNEERTTFDPVNKWKVYKWEHTDAGWTGALWFDNTNNETAGNYSNAITGTTIAYSGTLTDGYLAATAYTTGSNTHGTRFCVYTISDGAYAGAFRNKPVGITLAEYGHEVQMVVSPRDSMQFIFSSPNKEPFEWRMNTTTNTDITPVGTLPFHTNVANYFRYAKRSLMVCPAEDDAKQNIGVALYDITDGLNKAQLIATTNTALEASAAAYTAAFGVVSGADITLHLAADNLMSKFTTMGVEQAVVPAICAYDLNVTEASDVYTFSFVANAAATKAELVFTPVAPQGGNLTEGAWSLPIEGVVKGANEFAIPATQLPGKGVEMTWAVRLEGEAIADFGTLFSDKSLIASGTSRLKNTVNRNPESTKFGHIYIMHRAGSSASALRTNSGIFDYDYSFTKLNDTRYNGGESFGNPQRLSIDNDDHLYIADWADDHSGVFVMNIQDLSQPATQLFAGTRNGAGLFTNAGVAIGSSTPSAQIYQPNDSTRWMLVYNEDAAGTLPANGCAIYDLSATIGQSANPLIETAPFNTISLTGQANTEGNIQGTSHGFFVSQHRTSGNNNASATSLKFYDYDGNQLFSSASDEYKEIITGSEGGGYAIAPDESWLIMNDGDKQFLLFDIEWEGNKPILTLRYALKHTSLTYRQLNLDYAGNLIASGDQSWDVFSLPSATNVTTIPARKSLTVQASAGIALESLTFAVASIDVELDKTMAIDTLLTFTPAEASNKMVTYSSFDASIATVDAKGVVTAVKVGTTTIRATSLDGGFTADLTVNVKPVAVTGVEILSGTDGVMEINSGSNYALAFRVLPANAANTNTTWTSSNPDVVTCYEGTPGLIIGNQAGTSIITVTTEDGGFTATLTVYVDMEMPSDLPSVHQDVDASIIKYLHQGRLFILHNGTHYNAQGARMK